MPVLPSNPRALLRIGSIYLFPLVALKVFALALLLVSSAIPALEWVIIPWLEDHRRIAAVDWWHENERLVLNLRRNGASMESPLIHMVGDAPPALSKSRPRILVIGDSFVWGDGYANLNDVWWKQLDRELARRGYDVEIIAAGWGGISTPRELTYAKTLVPQYDPDLVIYGYVTNDPDVGMVPQHVAQVDPTFLFLNAYGDPRVEHYQGIGFPNLWRVLFQLHERKMGLEQAGPQNGYDYHQWELEVLKSPSIDKYAETINEVGAHCRAVNKPCFFVTLPGHPSKEYFEPRHGPVKPLFQRAGLPFHDLVDHFVEKHSDMLETPILEWGINPDNRHPGPRAAHFFASETADILERDHAAVLGPKAPRNKPLRINDWLPADLEISARSDTSITYTAKVSNLTLRMPQREPYVQLDLETPHLASEIQLEGAGVKKAELFVTFVDPDKGYDTGVAVSLGVESSEKRSWKLPPRLLSTVRIGGDIAESNAHVKLTILP